MGPLYRQGRSPQIPLFPSLTLHTKLPFPKTESFAYTLFGSFSQVIDALVSADDALVSAESAFMLITFH